MISVEEVRQLQSLLFRFDGNFSLPRLKSEFVHESRLDFSANGKILKSPDELASRDCGMRP